MSGICSAGGLFSVVGVGWLSGEGMEYSSSSSVRIGSMVEEFRISCRDVWSFGWAGSAERVVVVGMDRMAAGSGECLS